MSRPTVFVAALGQLRPPRVGLTAPQAMLLLATPRLGEPGQHRD